MAIITREEYKQLSNTTDTSLDSMIDLLVPIIEEDFLTIRGAPFELDKDEKKIYPPGAVFTAKLMLDWLLSPESKKALTGGKKSETIGKYSYSLQEIDGASGYPKAIIGRIETYVRGRV
jgi:hypothetical protein